MVKGQAGLGYGLIVPKLYHQSHFSFAPAAAVLQQIASPITPKRARSTSMFSRTHRRHAPGWAYRQAIGHLGTGLSLNSRRTRVTLKGKPKCSQMQQCKAH